ncbi:MAG: 8-oxo-dGTP diphosphatase [Patescibacteria group bacterium]
MDSKERKILTLCIVEKTGQILLGMKKRGFGEGRWNGFGGKVELSEAIEESAKREVREEAGIEPTELEERGVLDFEFQNDPKILEVHIFQVIAWKGVPKESEEMEPQWFDIEKIPFDQMWPDDRYWLPLFLEGKKFGGKFIFDRPSDQEYTSKIISKDLFETGEV